MIAAYEEYARNGNHSLGQENGVLCVCVFVLFRVAVWAQVLGVECCLHQA